jgi:hypothetical protein
MTFLQGDRPPAEDAEYEEEPGNITPPKPRQPLNITLIRNLMIVGALALAVGIGIAFVMNWNRVSQPAQVPPEYLSWGQACSHGIGGCAGDLVLFGDGRRWLVEGAANDATTLSAVIASDYLGVTDIIRLDDPDYLPALRAYYGRSAQGASPVVSPAQPAEPSP